MASYRAGVRCRERLERLGESSVGSEELRREAAAELQRAIGFDVWCWALADPSSLIASSGVASTVPDVRIATMLPRLLAMEQREEMLQRHEIAWAPRPADTLMSATDGALERSRRWAECVDPLGLGDLVIAASRDRPDAGAGLRPTARRTLAPSRRKTLTSSPTSQPRSALPCAGARLAHSCQLTSDLPGS